MNAFYVILMFIKQPLSTFCCFYQRPKGDPFVGVYQGHSTESRAKPRTDQVGGSDRGYFSFPEVRGSGTIMGQEEK